jgi:hypothetical protein
MRTQLTTAKRQFKLSQLVENEGYPNLDGLLRDAMFDSACPGICLADGCDYTTEVEPDQDRGWCECCCDNTVVSAHVLAELI